MSTGAANWRIVAFACGLWLAATAAFWPEAPTFRDEVGYIGQSRIALSGTLHPRPDDVCYTFRTSGGEIPVYPPFLSTLLMPLVAIAPRAAFGLGMLSALLLALEAARALERWGVSPVFGVAILLHPTVLLLSRTAMADLLLSAACLGAWNALDRPHRWWRTVAWFALLVAAKPIGVVLATGLLAGSWLERLRGGEAFPARSLWPAAAGVTMGLAVIALLNVAATGDLRYATVHSAAQFGLPFLPVTGWRHIVTLVLLPPGLGAGAWLLWKRRELGAIAAAAIMLLAMSAYYFADSGRTALESLVVAPRLILPVVALLMVGWLAGLSRTLPSRFRAPLTWLLLASCVVAPAGIGILHRRSQEAMRGALQEAEERLSLQGSSVLGVSESAFKAGVVASTRIVAVTSDVPQNVSVVLCSVEGESYRSAPRSRLCAFEGFGEAAARGPYRVLVRNR